MENTEQKLSLYLVLIHEIGHAMGFEHTGDKNSIMYPYYSNKTYLNDYDIESLQSVYGKKQNLTQPSLPPPPQTPPLPEEKKHITKNDQVSDLCVHESELKYFAVLENKLFNMHNQWIWYYELIFDNYVDVGDIGKPTLITDWLPFLPKNWSNVVGVFQRANREVVMIIYDMFYIFSLKTLQLVSKYPKRVSDMLSIPKNSKVNSIFITNSGRIYLIFNSVNYVELDDYYLIAKEYRSVTDLLPNIPTNFDSVFRHWNGNLYFFKKNKYYEFNEVTKKVVKTGKKSLGTIIGISCYRNALYSRLKDLLAEYNIYPRS